MTEEQSRIVALTYNLGLALGALELINVSPYNFNKDGLEEVIKRLKIFLDVPIIIYMDEPK